MASGNNRPDAAPMVPGEALALPDDSELMRQIGRRDDAAFRTLVDREAAYLYGVAHALSGNGADAEDLVQETLTAVMDGGFRGEASLRTWLVGILVRKAAMLRRGESRRRRNQTSRAAADLAESRRGTGGSEADTRLDLSVMLATLSPEHREVIILRELQGLSYEEIAAALRLPRGTVESRLHRAREALRSRFKDYAQH